MERSTKKLRQCEKGHQYYKTSDCPVCPQCDKEQKPQDNFISQLVAPARRALEGAGILTVEQLSKKTEAEILALHGMGPSTLPKLLKALQAKGLNFKRVK